MRKLILSACFSGLLAIPAVSAAGELTLTMNGGLVTLVAKDVPVSALLAEWARIGKTTIVNGDKILTPVSLHLENVPERQALDIVLRAAAGYMVAERSTPVAGASAFDRIMILATSRAPTTQPPLPTAPPPFAQPRPMAQPMVEDDQGNMVPMPPGGFVPGAPGAPGQPPGAPGQGPQPATPQLTAPRPGMLPAPPQQPVPFGTPRPGGGGPVPPAGSGGSPNLPGGGGVPVPPGGGSGGSPNLPGGGAGN